MAHSKQIFIIYGPTGVGKSDFALILARKLSGEIVNADVGQFYTPLSIGTAKPDWQASEVPHHLFDIIDEPVDFTVTQYRQLIYKTIENIWQRGKVPILVGGSGFYINSLFFPPAAEIIDNNFDDQLNDGRSSQELWQELNAIDPNRAQLINANDAYRIKRALAIWHKTGKKPSEFKPVYDPIASYSLLFLTRDRQELYGRIDKRVNEMIDAGWIDEAIPLKGTDWELFLKRKKLIGYDDILYFLDNVQHKNKKKLVEVISKKTRNYAKRQLTFWRMLEKKLAPFVKKDPQLSVETVNLTSVEDEGFIKKFVEK